MRYQRYYRFSRKQLTGLTARLHQVLEERRVSLERHSLAIHARIALVTRRSGTSIRGEFPARAGNKRLKNALFYSAWVASNSDPISKVYYDRKRAEGKRHNAAVICRAQRRCNVIFALLRDGTYYQPPAAPPAPESTALAA